MSIRSGWLASMLVALALVGCAGGGDVDSVTVTPANQSIAGGSTVQFTATGIKTHTGHPTKTVNLTNAAKWASSAPSIATVSATGLATALTAGTTTISATTNGFGGTLIGSATLTVTSGGGPVGALVSLSIIPAAITVGELQDTGQFLAIGTFSSVPYVRDLTNQPGTTWISSFPDEFPVNTNSGGTSSASAGIVTAYGAGTASITAEATSADGTIQISTATFSCPLVLATTTDPGTCNQGQVGPLKATLTVIGEGLNTTDWLLTAPSATGTPDVIHCGPGWTANGQIGGSVCVGIYPIGTKVIVTAPAQQGVAFGGWTYNCTPILPINAIGPNSCTIDLGLSNATVGAIFNNSN